MSVHERKAQFLASLRTMDRAQLENVLATVTQAVEALQQAQPDTEPECKLDRDVWGEIEDLL